MNSTSTSTTNNTTTGQGAPKAHGTGLAAKVKGAAQVVHGAGENIRGTLLGGVDTVVHDSDSTSTNDVIAAKGREQTARGLANLKGVPAGAGAGVGHPGPGYDSTSRYPPYAADAGTQNSIPNYDGPGNNYAGPGNQQTQYPTRHDRPVEEPHHHREDAIDLDATHGAAAGPGSTSVPSSRVN